MNNYVIKKLTSHEFDLLIPLMKDCFGMNVDVKYFEWKFLKNPSGFFEGFVAMAENGEIAAYYGVIPETYIINRTETIIYQSCDTMTHSRHRRKGLFQKLALHCYEYLQNKNELFVIGFGGEQSTPGFIKFGWAHIFDVRYYFYPKLFSSFYFKRTSKSIEEIQDFNKIETAIVTSNQFAEIHSHKALNIFRWRISNPRFKYKVIACKEKDGAYGSYLCYYIQDNKIVLFDFFFKNIITGKKLMGSLRNLLRKESYAGIIAFCKERSYVSKQLSKLNFISNPFSKGPLSQRTPFIYYASKEVMEQNSNPNKWFINSFDHDAL